MNFVCECEDEGCQQPLSDSVYFAGKEARLDIDPNGDRELRIVIPPHAKGDVLASGDGFVILEQIEAQLQNIKSKLQSLEAQTSDLIAQRRVLRLRSIELTHGVKAGLIVVSKGTEYEVTRVDTEHSFGFGKPWVSGNPKRKDGTWGTAHRNLYSDWTLKEGE